MVVFSVRIIFVGNAFGDPILRPGLMWFVFQLVLMLLVIICAHLSHPS